MQQQNSQENSIDLSHWRYGSRCSSSQFLGEISKNVCEDDDEIFDEKISEDVFERLMLNVLNQRSLKTNSSSPQMMSELLSNQEDAQLASIYENWKNLFAKIVSDCKISLNNYFTEKRLFEESEGHESELNQAVLKEIKEERKSQPKQNEQEDSLSSLIFENSSKGTKISQYKGNVFDKASGKEIGIKIQEQSWMMHLTRVSYAQTSLAYLCQSLNWSFKFTNERAKMETNMFSCTVIVVIAEASEYGLGEKFQAFYPAARNKREAKHNAAILCLAQMYLYVKGLWKFHQNLMKENPTLKMVQESNNWAILQQFNTGSQTRSQINLYHELNQEKQERVQEIFQYLSQIKSFKKELIYFIGQNNKIFMPLQWNFTPMNKYGFWEVEGCVKYEKESKIKEYRYRTQSRSKKQGQQKICKQILLNSYYDFPFEYTKFKSTKKRRALE